MNGEKMNKIIIALLAISLTTSAFAANRGLELLTEGDPSTTPFEKLEALFNQASPMQLSELPALKYYNIKKWECVGARSSTTVAQLKINKLVPVQMRGVNVVPEVPATPSQGPLFPGNSAIPKQYQFIDVILYVSTQGSYDDYSSKDIYSNEFFEKKLQLNTSPELTQIHLRDPSNPLSMVTETFRISDGLILIKAESNANIKKSMHFNYCYKR